MRLPVNCIILHIQHKIQTYFENWTNYTENITVILVLMVSNYLLLLDFGEMSVRTGRVYGIPQEGFGPEQMALFQPGFP